MHKRTLAVFAVSAVLGGLVAAPVAQAEDEDFSLTGRFTSFDREDNGDRGWSEGDEIDFTYDLFDGRDQAGDGDGTCVITKLDREERDFAADCEGTFDLEDGDLDLSGEVTDEDFEEGEVVLDVDGGTGDYDGAKGTATFSGARGRGGKGGHHHGMDASSVDTVTPLHGWGDGGRDKSDDGDGPRHARSHRGGGRHFKVDVDLD